MATEIDINRIQKDIFIEHKGEPYRVLDYEHVKPGKGQAFVRVKAKNMLTGNVTELTFKASDRIPLADFEQVYATYSYNDGENYYFMNTQTYDMIAVPKEKIEEEAKFLKEGMEVIVFLYKGQPIGIELPKHVELQVVETEPAFKGDTQAGGTKPAKLETGAVIQVPFFVKEGDIVKVDTRTGSYVERVKEAK
ncbi:elongation factor P [Aquifex aeolicus]|uniref:Elongation factor P n=1 Tax=Aquifex aeolicus (strain VF5) TaxID=224324 RepID=EFP_AQUAE|nr:elongation factor P [Aquifex aeolicus]O67376.1 RecName: Full=Elongation factor P; Short=EF-P [Aquifex aeolicus VF5]AAC07331.1 elongation factor P [Aquifex aeolicus VF5]